MIEISQKVVYNTIQSIPRRTSYITAHCTLTTRRYYYYSLMDIYYYFEQLFKP
jgi:hypothetical protein